MATRVKVTEGQTSQAQAPAPQAETFTFTTKRGDVIVAGKPRGVLKLKLRNILDLQEIEKDAELTELAKVVLSIRTINGEPPKCVTRMQFDTIIQNTFSDDTDLDAFMNEYQRFTQPEYHEFVTSLLKEAAEQGILEPEEIKAYMTKKFAERAQLNQEKVRL